MEKAIVLQNGHWMGRYGNLNHRLVVDLLKKRLPAKEVQVLPGIRRGGKSSIFKLVINQLRENVDPNSILYVNLDDPFFTPIYEDSKNLYLVVETAEKITGVKVEYLFLDELQHINSCEKFIKSVYDQEMYSKIFITGSNSSLLKGEYAQLLSGRYLVSEIFPYSFKEILYLAGITDLITLIRKKAKVLKMVESMMEFGGFPEVHKHVDSEIKREILVSYYETILLKDCIALGKIRDTKRFMNLAFYLATNVGTLYSYNKLAKFLGGNENSISEFIQHLTNGFLFYELKPFDYSLKRQFRGRKKIYCADNGIVNAVSFRFSSDKGKLFENLVFTELLKSKYDIYFYNGQRECDFIVKKDQNLKAIQVCYRLNDQNTEREFAGIKEAMRKFDIREGIIVTFDQEWEKDEIRVVPFWKYFS